MMNRIYRDIGGMFPHNVIHQTQQLIVQGGFEPINARFFVGFAVFFSLSVSVITFFITPFITQIGYLPPLLAVAACPFCLFMFYLVLVLNADARASRIEAVLPDALQLISSNIRAGMTLENAIWSSARPEFGPLQDEIKRVSADTFGGIPLGTTLTSMGGRVPSNVLPRAVKLIAEGIKLGAEMSKLLEEVARDIRSTQMLRKEISTSTLTYAIFIVFAGVLVAPMLFSVSTFYSQINQSFLAKTTQTSNSGNNAQMEAAEQSSGLGGLAQLGSASSSSGSTTGGVNPQDIYWFSIAAITITTFFASLILGEIQSGKATAGLKFVPVFVPLALGIFLVALAILQTLIGGLTK
jgi:pilus assembly protein TadC